jgi:hypothetical protein
MIILAHRGLWASKREQNGIPALCDALRRGCGIETDIREDRGQLVISHDCPTGAEPAFNEFLEAVRALNSTQIMALNIKEDGLQAMLESSIAQYAIPPERFFLFDMAVPDAMGYLARSMPCFTRQSEVEEVPAFVDSAAGVWLDCFYKEWIDVDVIRSHFLAGRRVALVSPELHGREKMAAWPKWREAEKMLLEAGQADRLMICTDYPLEARAYFNGED